MNIKFDCGLTDEEHCDIQSWLDIYDLIMNLHDSVSDINSFVNEYSHKYKNRYGVFEILEPIYSYFKPALDLLQKANKKIRSRYGLVEQHKSLPSGRPPISR